MESADGTPPRQKLPKASTPRQSDAHLNDANDFLSSSSSSSNPTRSASAQLEHFTRMNLAARAATPDVAADPLLPGLASQSTSQQPSSSPPKVSGHAHSHSSSRPPPSRALSQNEDDSHTRREAHPPSRLRTRTLEDTPRQDLGAASRSRQCQRVSSMNQPVEPSSRERDSSAWRRAQQTSKQTAEPAAAATAGSHRNSISSHLKRPIATEPSPRARSRAGPMLIETTMPVTDPRKMFSLMSKTRGRMQGNLAYLHNHHADWDSAWCCIRSDEASLICESETGYESPKVLVPDLRGCLVTASLDPHTSKPLLNLSSYDEKVIIQLKPLNESYFNAWFAAFLCWNPVLPGHRPDNSSVQHPTPLGWLSESKGIDLRSTPLDKARVIKAGKAILVEPDETKPLTASAGRIHPNSPKRQTSPKWTTVSCVLAENGDLKLTTENDNLFVAKICLSRLSRSAVQRLHPTVLDIDCCIGIYPQYSRSADACSRLRPLFLYYDELVVFEAWFVLLRAFTIPELYGPSNMHSLDPVTAPEILPGLPQDSNPPLLRIERGLLVKISEVKLNKRSGAGRKGQSSDEATTHSKGPRTTGYYMDIAVDGQKKAKTAIKRGTLDPFWYETFEFLDLAAVLSSVTIRLFKLDEPDPEAVLDTSKGSDSIPGHMLDVTETCLGDLTVHLGDIERSKDVEKWWPLHNDARDEVGELLFRIRFDQEAMLMDKEYDDIYDMLHHFPNGLTLQIAENIPTELAALSRCMLNIFEVSMVAEDWLMALAEEEIDGIMKDPPPGRTRWVRRLESNESRASLRDIPRAKWDDRETLVRDLGRTATAEVNLLFRGNTLVSKALDYHMKRLGKAYLDMTIGPKLRDILNHDLDCEIDPDKVHDRKRLQANRGRLLQATKDVWLRIYESPMNCPSELRTVFRHIRACAQDRYGDYLRTVTYSSVSGFIFLRFFCAAILTPQAFDLVRHDPSLRSSRTFTLIAKSLQGLANMSTFGIKEPWMEPMNLFLNSHRQQFKDFIDVLCDVPSGIARTRTKSPSYSTPMAIYQRLPPASKEGFPSLPYHIDRARNVATLINLWLDNYGKNYSGAPPPLEGELKRFHDLCHTLRQRTNSCYAHAERAERRNSSLSQRWVAIAERMESAPNEFWIRQRFYPQPIEQGPTTIHISQPPVTTESSVRPSHDLSSRRRAASSTHNLTSEDDLGSASAEDVPSRPDTPTHANVSFVSSSEDEEDEARPSRNIRFSRSRDTSKERSRLKLFGRKRKKNARQKDAGQRMEKGGDNNGEPSTHSEEPRKET